LIINEEKRSHAPSRPERESVGISIQSHRKKARVRTALARRKRLLSRKNAAKRDSTLSPGCFKRDEKGINRKDRRPFGGLGGGGVMKAQKKPAGMIGKTTPTLPALGRKSKS